MDQQQVFISYAHEDETAVNEIVKCLEKQGVECWYAPRDVGPRRYAKAICEAIETSRIFLLILSEKSAVSEHVLNEVEMAYNKRKASNGALSIQTLCLKPLNLDSSEFDEIMYYIRRINFIQAERDNAPYNLANQFINENKSILRITVTESKIKADADSKYFPSERETKRLEVQNRLLKNFEQDIYNQYLTNVYQPKILDVGCGNGMQITDRVASACGVYTLLGIDRDKAKIDYAREKYGSDNTFFEVCDISNKEFENDLQEISKRYGIEKYDVINISMLLLHIKEKTKLLRILRRMLSEDGIIIIRDIDDGLNFAFPDDENVFERIYKICDENETSGLRRNGRRIYTNLVLAGFRNITLEKEGLSSIGMTYDEKDDFFNMYFKMILGDIKWMREKYPDNWEIKENCEWYEENYDNVYEMFMRDDFVFSLGFQIYTAKK